MVSKFITSTSGKKISGNKIFDISIPISATPPTTTTLDITLGLERSVSEAYAPGLTTNASGIGVSQLEYTLNDGGVWTAVTAPTSVATIAGALGVGSANQNREPRQESGTVRIRGLTAGQLINVRQVTGGDRYFSYVNAHMNTAPIS